MRPKPLLITAASQEREFRQLLSVLLDTDRVGQEVTVLPLEGNVDRSHVRVVEALAPQDRILVCGLLRVPFGLPSWRHSDPFTFTMRRGKLLLYLPTPGLVEVGHGPVWHDRDAMAEGRLHVRRFVRATYLAAAG